MVVRTVVWLGALLSAVVSKSAASYLSCDNITLHSNSCSCFGQTPTLYELICSQLAVQLNLHESVQLQCTSDSPVFSTLAGLQIGDVERFVLRLCLLPDTSIRELMASMGINKIKMLQIQSYYSLNNTLQKKHLEKLYEVTILSLNNNGLTSLPSDIFEDLGNLTWLDMKFNFIDLPKEIFYFTPKLEVLELGKNNLIHLKPGIFKNLERLRLLNLWGNKLVNITRAVFSDVPNLESLDLNSNQMETIRPDLFADLIKLKKLSLYANAFVSLPQGLLSRNLDLEEFQMQDNKRPLVSLPIGFLSNLTELKMVRLSGCKLMSLPEDTFSGSKNIQTLYLNHNHLKSLAEKLFMDLEDLELLDLSQNLITHLPEGLFTKTRKLSILKLHYNQLTEIPPRLFLHLKKLEYLDLRYNKIKEIKGEQFYNLESLKTLNISDNQLTKLASDVQLDDFGKYSVLHKCNSLEDLQLANNSLTEIYGDWRLLLNMLHTLNIAFNHIRFLETNDLDFISDVSIDLSNNNITLVNFWKAKLTALSHLDQFNSTYERDSKIKPKHIRLDNNPLNCDCQLLPFVQFVQNGLSPEVQYLFDIPDTNLKCHEPKNLQNVLLNYVSQGLLTCEIKNETYICPEGCICQYRTLDKGNIVNCQNAGLQQMPLHLYQYFIANHSELNLEGNHLRSFMMTGNHGYKNVTHFYLSSNNITSLNISGISNKLKVLDLSDNNLTMLSTETISFLEKAPELEMIALHGNPWQCNCDAKPLIRLLKNRFKQVIRLHNISCSDGIPLEKKDESELCPERAGVLVILCVICAIIGFLMAVLTALYYRYETEIRIYCFSSKWKILRWLVSHPDIDVDKKYDAFISYSHEDEPFVMEYLIPHLEENGDIKFKLCLHFRDWVPGESIPNQILHSVQHSRRTIVVLSPSFLESVWGKVEFRTAHSEALKDGTARVIVLLYEDVGPICDLDEELKAYLQMNTYVKWGSPWFWKQLYYALPHPPENANDIKCVFGCFPRIRKDSNSHEILQNVQIKDGEVHYMSDIDMSEKVNGKDTNSSHPAIPKSTPLIIECLDTKPKHFCSENHENRTAVIDV